jgi:hypothetical protein
MEKINIFDRLLDDLKKTGQLRTNTDSNSASATCYKDALEAIDEDADNNLKRGNTMNEEARSPIADVLLEKFITLAARAQAIAQQTVGTLAPIMHENEPERVEETKTPEEEPYPPLLSDYRDNLYLIQDALSTIERCLERAEI